MKDKVYLITDSGQVIGALTPRTPRKLKKQQKKAGTYQRKIFGGIDFGKVFAILIFFLVTSCVTVKHGDHRHNKSISQPKSQ
jgi:hypothetical protein